MGAHKRKRRRLSAVLAAAVAATGFGAWLVAAPSSGATGLSMVAGDLIAQDGAGNVTTVTSSGLTSALGTTEAASGLVITSGGERASLVSGSVEWLPASGLPDAIDTGEQAGPVATGVSGTYAVANGSPTSGMCNGSTSFGTAVTAGTVVALDPCGPVSTTLPTGGPSDPAGLAEDAAGTLWAADPATGEVWSWAPGDTGWTAFSHGGSAVSFADPDAVAVDRAGDVYVADGAAGTVTEFAADGSVLHTATIADPFGLTLDSFGDLYVLSGGTGTGTGNAITKYDPFLSQVWDVAAPYATAIAVWAPTPSWVSGSPGHLAAVGTPFSYVPPGTDPSGAPVSYQIDDPADLPPGLSFASTTGALQGTPTTAGVYTFSVTAANAIATASSSVTVTVEGSGTAVVSDGDNASGSVVAVLPDGTLSTLASGVSRPEGVTVDLQGDVYYDDSAGDVVEIPATGAAPATIATGVPDTGGLAVDPLGDVYYPDPGDGSAGAGSIGELVRGNGYAAATVATGLDQPDGLTFDGSGDLFVADGADGSVAELPADGGSPVTVVTGGSAADPVGISVDPYGQLLIADPGAATVDSHPADDGPPNPVGSGWAAPRAVAGDSVGDVFVVDAVGAGSAELVEVTAGGQATVATGQAAPTAVAVFTPLHLDPPAAPVIQLAGGTALGGTPYVGDTLQVAGPSSSGAAWPAGISTTYAWYAGPTLFSSAATPTLAAAQAGQVITVRVTVTEAGGLVPASAVSPATAAVVDIAAPPAPVITGTAQSGSTLGVAAIPADPSWGSGYTLEIDWFAGGQPVGTGRSLSLGDGEVGEQITAVAKVTVAARPSRTVSSPLSAAVGPVAGAPAPPSPPAGSPTASPTTSPSPSTSPSASPSSSTSPSASGSASPSHSSSPSGHPHPSDRPTSSPRPSRSASPTAAPIVLPSSQGSAASRSAAPSPSTGTTGSSPSAHPSPSTAVAPVAPSSPDSGGQPRGGGRPVSTTTGTGGWRDPSGFTDAIPTIGEVVEHPGTLLAAALEGIIFILPLVLLIQLLNRSIDDYFYRWSAWWRRRFPRSAAVLGPLERRLAGESLGVVLGFLGITAAVEALADPGARPDGEMARVVLSTLLTASVTMLGSYLVTAWYVRRRYGLLVRPMASPWGFVAGVAGVVLSRAISFTPGLLVGFDVLVKLRGDADRVAQVRALRARYGVLLLCACATWALSSVVRPPAGSTANPLLLLVHDALVAATVGGISTTLVNLLPLPHLPGGLLARRARVSWAVITGCAVAGFCLVVAPRAANWLEIDHHRERWIVVAAVAVTLSLIIVGHRVVTLLRQVADEA